MGYFNRKAAARLPYVRTVVEAGRERTMTIAAGDKVYCYFCDKVITVDKSTAFRIARDPGETLFIQCPECRKTADAFYYFDRAVRPGYRPPRRSEPAPILWKKPKPEPVGETEQQEKRSKRYITEYKPPAPQEELLRLYGRGLSDVQIAKATGSTANKIAYWRRKYNLEANVPPGGGRGYDWNRAREMWEAGASDREIAEELGCKRPAVVTWRKNNDLKINYQKGKGARTDLQEEWNERSKEIFEERLKRGTDE